jgi:hypothetical protein
MASFRGYSGERGKSESPLRLCGNCAHAPFKLSETEKNLMFETLRRYSPETVQVWLKSSRKEIFQVGRGGKLDVEKTRFVQLAQTTCFCRAAGATVSAVERNCYLWLPTQESFS